MTLNQFLDAAYALLVDEYRRLGSSLIEALERTREYAAGNQKPPSTAGGKTEEALVPSSQLSHKELENERAMAEFEKAMSGVSF